jgi:hypothetical protein
MGEFADDALNALVTDPDSWWTTYRQRLIRCKYCGTNGLHWGSTQSGYRLFDRHSCIHECRDYLLHCSTVSGSI